MPNRKTGMTANHHKKLLFLLIGLMLLLAAVPYLRNTFREQEG